MLTVDANVWISATEPSDRFHAISRAFLAIAVQQRHTFYLPSIAWVEVPCALARRLGDPRAGVQLAMAILAQPEIHSVALDADMLRFTVEVGPRLRIRGADALYAAVALHYGAQLVSWDRELVERAGAVTPPAWLARQP